MDNLYIKEKELDLDARSDTIVSQLNERRRAALAEIDKAPLSWVKSICIVLYDFLKRIFVAGFISKYLLSQPLDSSQIRELEKNEW